MVFPMFFTMFDLISLEYWRVKRLMPLCDSARDLQALVLITENSDSAEEKVFREAHSVEMAGD